MIKSVILAAILIVTIALLFDSCTSQNAYALVNGCNESSEGLSQCNSLRSRCSKFTQFIDSSSVDNISCCCND